MSNNKSRRMQRVRQLELILVDFDEDCTGDWI